MIERQTINGRPATVGYLDQGFSPADKDTAPLVKVSFDDGETLFLSTKSPAQYAGEAEADAWNRHRDRHRAPVVAPTPYELRQKSRREQTPHNAAVAGFSDAINVAEKHRRTLKRRFGYDDRQIGTLAINYNLRKRTP